MKIHIDGIIYGLQKTGGISRYFNEYLSLLGNLNDKINIEIMLPKKPRGVLPKAKNINIIFGKHLNTRYHNRVSRYLAQFINKYTENKYWGKITEGIFHSTYFTTYKNLKIPQVLTIHDMTYEKFPAFFNKKPDMEFIKRKKRCVDSSDAIICVSEHTRQDVINYYDIDKNKVSVIHLGVNHNFKKITDETVKKNFLKRINIQKPYLLYVGGRKGYKNFSTLLYAFNILTNKDLDMVVVGGGEFTEEENNIINGLSLRNRIYNLGFVPDNELIMLYNCAAAFVFPSLYEGFGIPILEAMACGTPMALSNVSSLPEVAGDSAIYFNPRDIDDMANKIRQAISEGGNSEYVKTGFERVKHFSWNKTAQETFNVYKRVYEQHNNNNNPLA